MEYGMSINWEKWKLFIGIMIAVLALDHLTKLWIVQNVPYGSGFAVIDGFFDIVHLRNKGAAFGFLHMWHSPLRNLFFYAIGACALLIILFFFSSTPRDDSISRIAFSLIAGGALGNLSDRFIRGSVVDFLSVHYHDTVWQFGWIGRNFTIPLNWPAFNLADSAITLAIILLLYRAFLKPYS